MAVNFNKFTIKAQDAIQAATEIASSYGNQQIEPEHLFAALLQSGESVVVSILKKIGTNVDTLKIKTNELIEKIPKVSGTAGGQQYMSQALSKILEDSFKAAGSLKDEYVSVEHILLAMTESSDAVGK